MTLLVFDIGGTFTKYGLWHHDTLIESNKFKTPENWEKMKEQLVQTKVHFDASHHIEGVAFSVPGAPNAETRQIEGESLVEYLHFFPIYDELEEAFGVPVAFENDANCAALAEVAQGSAMGIANALFVIIGTGIGGTVLVNHDIVNGHNQYAGEFGFMLMNEKEENFGELATAVAMSRRYAVRKGLDPATVSGEHVFASAQKGDKVAQEEVDTFFYYLTVGIYNLTTILNPEKVIVGGGVSNLEGFVERIEQEIDALFARIYHFPYRPNIERATFKSEANLIGAASHYEKTFP